MTLKAPSILLDLLVTSLHHLFLFPRLFKALYLFTQEIIATYYSNLNIAGSNYISAAPRLTISHTDTIFYYIWFTQSLLNYLVLQYEGLYRSLSAPVGPAGQRCLHP